MLSTSALWRGLNGVKDGHGRGRGTLVKVAVAHGLPECGDGPQKKVRAAREAGDPPPPPSPPPPPLPPLPTLSKWMACPGGCIGGGGQPYELPDHPRPRRHGKGRGRREGTEVLFFLGENTG